MTEAEIAQALQARLAAPVRIAVKRRQGHLHVLLNRPPLARVDYPHLTERVRVELRALGLPGLEQVTVYGRESGHSEYEWEQTAPLLNPLLASEETTVLLEKKGDRLLQDLTVVAPDSVNSKPEPAPENPVGKTDIGSRSRISWVWLGGAVLIVGIGVTLLLVALL